MIHTCKLTGCCHKWTKHHTSLHWTWTCRWGPNHLTNIKKEKEFRYHSFMNKSQCCDWTDIDNVYSFHMICCWVLYSTCAGFLFSPHQYPETQGCQSGVSRLRPTAPSLSLCVRHWFFHSLLNLWSCLKSTKETHLPTAVTGNSSAHDVWPHGRPPGCRCREAHAKAPYSKGLYVNGSTGTPPPTDMAQPH